MACYHPLRAFDTGLLTDNGKPKYKICGPETDKIHPSRVGGLVANHGKVIQDQWITDYTPIPCGRCIGCRLDYSRMWADRCMLEAQQYEHNAFITLTYDPDHLPPLKDVLCPETGEIGKWPSLVPDDLTKFMKDLRRYYEYHFNHKNIRFYACGEYGSDGGRPHFHILAFNLPIPDLQHWFTRDKMKYYVSETLSSIWSDGSVDEKGKKIPKGIVTITDVTWNSAAYVARYVVKKQKGDTKGLVDICGNLLSGIEPEFVRMSRKPGIAWKYYDEHKHQFYETDEIVMSVRGKVRTIKPPRYFDKMYDIECEEADGTCSYLDPFKMKDIKKSRADNAKKSMQDQLSRTSLNEQEYLSVKERNKLAAVEKLVRKFNEI